MIRNHIFQIGLPEYGIIIRLVESRALSEINQLQSLHDHCKDRKITEVHLFDIPQYAGLL